jgi:hypothetical protein
VGSRNSHPKSKRTCHSLSRIRSPRQSCRLRTRKTRRLHRARFIVMAEIIHVAAFASELRSALAEPAGGGTFTETTLTPSGTVVHRFSWSTGMGSLLVGSSYVKKLGKIPRWVPAEHPYHRAVVLQTALRHGQPLPGERPSY